MKGILFKPDMVKAIVEGRKTVTRRLLNPQPFMERGILRWQPKRTNGYRGMHKPDINMDDHSDLAKMFANYQVGEVVYIKEAHRYIQNDGDPYDFGIQYKLDSQVKWWRDNGNLMDYPIDEKWRSPLFLKEIFARYFIQIAGVKAEQVQEITDDDAKAEGVTRPPNYSLTPHYRVWFQYLWNKINRDYPFESNPYIFRYEFALTPKGNEVGS